MNPCHTHIDDLCTEEDSHQCHWSCHSGLAECDMSLVSLVSLVEECHCTLCEHWDPTELWSLWHCSACHCTLYSSTSVTLSRLWESLLTINIIISNIIVSVFSRPVLTLMMCGDLILTSLSGLQSPVVSDQVTCVQCVQCTVYMCWSEQCYNIRLQFSVHHINHQWSSDWSACVTVLLSHWSDSDLVILGWCQKDDVFIRGVSQVCSMMRY